MQDEEGQTGYYSEQSYDAPLEEAVDEKQQTPSVEWQASEYEHHQKTSIWFIVLGFIAALAIGATYLLVNEWGIDDWVLVLLILAMTVAIAVYANRKPQTLAYHLDYEGLDAGERFYPLDEFRSFQVTEQPTHFSAELISLQRFRPPLLIHFSNEDAENIVKILSDTLPHEERQLDFIDQFFKKIRF